MNYELEKTEELIAYAGKKSKKKIILTVVITAVVLAVGIGVFAGIKLHHSSQINGYLETAEQELQEGKYKEAIASYEKVMKLDSKNAKAYEGLGDAHAGVGDTKKALNNYETAKKYDDQNEDLYKKEIRIAFSEGNTDEANAIVEEMHKNIKGTEAVDIRSVFTGSTQENMMSDGIVCQDGSTLYIANKPERGSITKVDKEGKETVIVRNKDLSDDKSVRGLNVWNGWLYYGISFFDQNSPHSCYEMIKRVKTDGTQDEKINIKDSGFMTFALIQGKLYWAGEFDDGGWEITQCDLDGKNLKKISKYHADHFVTDGKYIYYSAEVKAANDYIKDEFRRIDIHTGKEETVLNRFFNPFYIKGNTMYGFARNVGEQGIIYAWDMKTGSMALASKVGFVKSYNVNEGKIIWSRHGNGYSSELIRDYYRMEIEQTSLADDSETSTITHSFNFEELFPKEANREDCYADIDRYQIIGDKLYYSLEVSSDKGTTLKYGCMNTDGSENEIYY